MSLNPRQTEILQALKLQRDQSIEALAQRHGVSVQTVRRDVQRLADEGLLERFHGGVRLLTSTTENLAYRQRQAMRAEAKAAIGREVARHVPHGCSLFMNIGTTVEAVARALMHHQGLRVITNNLHVAALMSAKPDFEVIVVGGDVRSSDQAIVGGAATEFIRQFRVDIGLIGISGIETDGTLRDFELREVTVARAIIAQSRKVWLAADASKFNRPAMVALGRLSDIDRLFTDGPVPAPFDALLAESSVECILAPSGP